MMSILRTAAGNGKHRSRRAIRLILTDRPGRGLYREEMRRLAQVLDMPVLAAAVGLTRCRSLRITPVSGLV